MKSSWGTSRAERSLHFPADILPGQFDEDLYRGVTVHVAPIVLYSWLCQMRVAPYSYDWIDNLGRRSPRTLTPGLDNLSVRQRVMYIFRLVSFEPNRQLTLRLRPRTRAARFFGDVVGTYMIVPKGASSCRLIVKLRVRYPPGAIGWLMRLVLPWGDLLMMRRQLLNFKLLSERENLVMRSRRGKQM